MIRNIKILFFSFLSIILLNSLSYSKSLPPGSGAGDVPANVLILLDKSGSMSVPTTVGAALGSVRSMHPLTSGDIIFFNTNRLKRLNHSNNAITKLETGGNRMSYRQARRNKACHTSNVRNLIVNNNIAYAITSRGQFFSVALSNLNCQKIQNGYNGSEDSELILHDNKIYIISRSKSVIDIYDINTGSISSLSTSGTIFGEITDDMNRNSVVRVRTQFDIDSSGNLVVARQQVDNPNNFQLFKFSLSSWTGNASETYTLNNQNLASWPSGLAAHPSDSSIFYVPSRTRNQIYKLEISGGSISVNTTVGRSGRVQSGYNPVSKSQVRFRSPSNIKIANNLVYVNDSGNQVFQTFDLNLEPDDHSGTSRTLSRMQGAHEAILSIVNDSSLTASVNVGFSYWSSLNSQIWISPRNFRKGGQSSFPCKHLLPGQAKAHLNPGWVTSNAWWVKRNWKCVVLNPNATYGYSRWDAPNNQSIPCDGSNCLKIRVDRNGARNIRGYIRSVRPGGGTDADAWATIAEEYYYHGSESPALDAEDCQGNYIIVIGDGDMFNTDKAETRVKRMLSNPKKVKTFTVAYGGGLTTNGMKQLDIIAKAGGTERAVRASTPDILKAELQSAIRAVIADKLSFTAPAITATVNEGGSLYQAQFKYKQNKDWEGVLTKFAIDENGKVGDIPLWNAQDELPDPDKRKIWSIIPGTDYKSDYNNITEANADLISPEFLRLNNKVLDYHTVTPVGGATNNRCVNKGDSGSSIEDGNEDDIKGLISYIRGEDYFDVNPDNGDCNLNKYRINDEGKKAYLGDIYHSEMVVVGKPSAFTNFTNKNQESFFRTNKGYSAFRMTHVNREEMIYVGANDGMLHAFNAKDGIEKWAFIPPFVLGKMPLVINPFLNKDTTGRKGGSNAIYGVDGSPVVHDIFFKGPHDDIEKWHTILMIPFGRGGNGFSVLDVTIPHKPLHLYTIYNDAILNKVLYMDHDGDNVIEYNYIDDMYSIADFEESREVTDKFTADENIDADCVSDLSLNTSCYKSDTWTFPVSNIQDGDVTIFVDGEDKTSDTTISVDAGTGKTTFEFSDEYFYQANDDPQKSLQDPVEILVKLSRSKLATLNTDLPPEFDYKELGETWSSPRILRVPNDKSQDKNTLDDIYVAVMGGGYGGREDNVGSAVFVINLQDPYTDPTSGAEMWGKLYETSDKKGVVLIDDTVPSDRDLDIVNSVTGSPVVITADIEPSANFSGGMVYVNDMEGKITKINLTNQPATEMLESSVIFETGSTTKNGQFMFHGMDAVIESTSKNLWLFAGTGDYERIVEKSDPPDKEILNYMIGFRDKDYPVYKNTPAREIKDLNDCTEMLSGATSGCPATSTSSKDNGWYVPLKRDQKVTAEPTAANEHVFFPVFEPLAATDANKCAQGAAYICKVDDGCGFNKSTDLKLNAEATSLNKECAYVGKGVLSKVIVFGNNLYANIAGESVGDKTDLVEMKDKKPDITYFRSSWREGNF